MRKLDDKDYFAIHDLTIQQPDGKSTQIDHIVVSRYGVFVIETKNYTGWIMGSEKSEYWTQVIYRRKERLYNPIRQNYGHIKALENVLGDPSIPFISIVAFSTRAELKLEPMSTEVIYATRMVPTIQKYTTVLLTEEQVSHLKMTLANLKTRGASFSKQHVSQVKQKLKDTESKIQSGQCPKCGGRLVERRGKNGRFLGCSQYPKCRFTRGME